MCSARKTNFNFFKLSVQAHHVVRVFAVSHPADQMGKYLHSSFTYASGPSCRGPRRIYDRNESNSYGLCTCDVMQMMDKFEMKNKVVVDL